MQSMPRKIPSHFCESCTTVSKITRTIATVTQMDENLGLFKVTNTISIYSESISIYSEYFISATCDPLQTSLVGRPTSKKFPRASQLTLGKSISPFISRLRKYSLKIFQKLIIGVAIAVLLPELKKRVFPPLIKILIFFAES
jgi:hypothetical protein